MKERSKSPGFLSGDPKFDEEIRAHVRSGSLDRIGESVASYVTRWIEERTNAKK